MKIELKLTGVDGVINLLQSLPAEIVSKRGGPVRSALLKSANIVKKEALKNLDVVTRNSTTNDKRENTGLLKKSVIASRGKQPYGTKGERYLVRIKRKVYVRKGKSMVTTLAGQALEYGTSKQPAEPWLRPAFKAKAEESIRAFEKNLMSSINRIVKKLGSTK